MNFNQARQLREAYEIATELKITVDELKEQVNMLQLHAAAPTLKQNKDGSVKVKAPAKKSKRITN